MVVRRSSRPAALRRLIVVLTVLMTAGVGHKYLLEVDEFVDLFSARGLSNLQESPVGAARIITVDNPRRPRIVSDIRLEVHQPAAHAGEQLADPGAWFPAQGYAAHYCGVPTRRNPKIAGCSMILSGLRLFDIRDVKNPREVAYFNKPVTKPTKLTVLADGAYAMSQPAWDPATGPSGTPTPTPVSTSSGSPTAWAGCCGRAQKR